MGTKKGTTKPLTSLAALRGSTRLSVAARSIREVLVLVHDFGTGTGQTVPVGRVS
jgi:hypothetical protein